MQFKEIYSATTGESFHSFISTDGRMLIQHPIKDEGAEWELIPYTNDARFLNQYYKYAENPPIMGGWSFVYKWAEYIDKKIKDIE